MESGCLLAKPRFTNSKASWDNENKMDDIRATEPSVPQTLAFAGFHGLKPHVALPPPHGNQSFTCVWIKNNQLASGKPICNIHARIEYLHDGAEEFVVHSASWWHDPSNEST